MAKMTQYVKAIQQAVDHLGEGHRLVDFELENAYLAYLIIEQVTDGRSPIRAAAVCSFSFGQDEQGDPTVVVQEMLGETQNPRPAAVSGRLLEALSPPATEVAAEWRRRCRGFLALKRQRFGPQPGDVISTRGLGEAELQQAFYILQSRGRTTADGLGLLDGRKYRLRFDDNTLTAVLYGKAGLQSTLHARFDYTYRAGAPAEDAAGRPDDLTP